MQAPTDGEEKPCWITLLTKPSYLPGAIILAYTLDKYKSKYPLLIQYTSSLGEEAIKTLEEEAKNFGRIKLYHVDFVLPRQGQENVGSVAERFKDTYTKLRAWEVYKLGYTQACFLDADMAVFQNPDEIFNIKLPGRDWLGANHACICNLDRNEWAPADWHKGNCAYTPLTSPDQIAADILPDARPTYRLLNGGMLLFYPTEKTWNDMMDFFNASTKLKDYQFPDQDFLGDYYWDKWTPVSWKWNALKTMRYWHPRMWSDTDLVILHWIVDKPWERQVSPEGVAGHLGRDGETHQWWWDIYKQWLQERKATSDSPLVIQTMDKLVDKQEPFTKYTPLPQEIGKPEDVKPWP